MRSCLMLVLILFSCPITSMGNSIDMSIGFAEKTRHISVDGIQTAENTVGIPVEYNGRSLDSIVQVKYNFNSNWAITSDYTLSRVYYEQHRRGTIGEDWGLGIQYSPIQKVGFNVSTLFSFNDQVGKSLGLRLSGEANITKDFSLISQFEVSKIKTIQSAGILAKHQNYGFGFRYKV